MGRRTLYPTKLSGGWWEWWVDPETKHSSSLGSGLAEPLFEPGVCEPLCGPFLNLAHSSEQLKVFHKVGELLLTTNLHYYTST